jgi:hypothetical protein
MIDNHILKNINQSNTNSSRTLNGDSGQELSYYAVSNIENIKDLVNV